MADTKRYLLFAGINGAGKSTLYRSDLWHAEQERGGLPRVNSDEIAAAHGWDWNDRAAQIAAGKEALALIKHYFENGISFNQETTLTGRLILRNIARAKAEGYHITMYYIGLENPQIANERIARRIDHGGHGIDAETVIRRAKASIENLISTVPLCDEVFLFDNTYLLKLVARIMKGDLVSYESGLEGITWPHDVMRRLIAQC